jgi:hypothetical protein
LAACGDGTVAPPTRSAEIASARGGGSNASLTGFDTLRFSFVIDPSRVTTYNLGAGNRITFPAGSLCDPSNSSYGAGTWDQPCPVAQSPVTISAKAWLDASGDPRIDFSPDVRFVPTANPLGWVTITFTDFFASIDPLAAILYCRTPTAGCTNEALTDPTLATVVNPVTGTLTRRIKHFSGYNVAAGDAALGFAAFNKRRPRSGFMLASGRSGR